MYKVIENYKELVDEVNKELNAFEKTFNVISSNKHMILDALLYTRVRDGYAAIIKLIINDLHTEAKIIARSTIEAYFKLVTHIDQPELSLEKLKNQSICNSNTMKIKTLCNGKYSTLLDEAKESDVSKMKKFNKENSTNIEKWAKLANKVEIYDYPYAFFSEDVHADLVSLEKKLVVEEKTIKGFKQGLDDSDLDKILSVTLDMMISSMKLINEKYQLESNKDCNMIDVLEEKLYEIANLKH